MRTPIRFLLLAGVLLTGLSYAASAFAAEPWFQVSVSSRPGNVIPGSAADEVQRLTVDAGSGEYRLTDENRDGIHFPESAFVKFNATHDELQKQLEGMYGAGNVEVPKGDGFGTEPYEIIWKGELADEAQEPLAPEEGRAHVTEVTKGKPDGELVVHVENLGDAPLEGESNPATILDKLPAGVTPLRIYGYHPSPVGSLLGPQHIFPLPCSLAALTCTLNTTLPPFEEAEVRIPVKATAAHSGELDEASISGGAAPPASTSSPLAISDLPTPFEVSDYRLSIEEEGGAPATEAGSHPFQVTGDVAINEGEDTFGASEELGPDVEPAALAKDVITKLPRGLIGNPSAVPTCSVGQFLKRVQEREDECPPQSAIGVASATVNLPGFTHAATFTYPLFNLERSPGEPARFGFYIPVSETGVTLDTSLRSGAGEGAVPGDSEDYGVNVIAHNISQTGGLAKAHITIWGVPGDSRHSQYRGWSCLAEARGVELGPNRGPCLPFEEPLPPAFLSLPTSCEGALRSSVEADPWSEPGAFHTYFPSSPLPSLDGCNRLAFDPTLRAQPSSDSASSPTGLDVNLDFHDEGLTSPDGVAESQLKDTTVTLPEGLTINPSAGVGLGGCTPADYAREALDSTPGAGCPNNSKLGTVEVVSPLLTTPIHGSLYVAQPFENPFDSLVALYIVLKNPETGVLIKLAGKVTPNLLTGQLVTSFENTPQLPFAHFNFHFREGAQAPLITPATCGLYTTQAALTPWANPLSPLTESSSFEITSGVGGGPCPSGGVPPFKPGIVAGMLNNNAGSYSPFYLHLTRTDGEQEISGFSTNLPPGLTGSLTGIPFCPEADIEAARHKTGAQEQASPSCPASSQVGHTLVGTGVGAVLAYVPGKIYLAGPFHGAPFSLVSVTSAAVGPFDLGTVVLRFGLDIDPSTAQVNVSPTSSEPIPTIIDGIVAHVRDIRVYVERPGNAPFTLNPTSCAPLAIGSTLSAAEGGSATVASPFQAASCANLKFEPKFAVSTSGKTSKADGASLHVSLTYPNTPQGTQANIKQVKVELPKQLPSRLTTLQKACTAKQFHTNPAGCPAESIIGHAKAVTPLIPVPLEGPAYFVSNGGEAFPNLVMVLQGYGVTIDLVGDTFISKAGVTSSTFKAVPDQPVGSFELTLPEGKFSALAANGNFCSLTHVVTTSRKVTRRVRGHNKRVTVKTKKTVATSLQMPTEFIAQNGTEIHETTPVRVTGCAKGKPVTKKTKKKHSKSKHTKKK
jgi:hypothetical protein